MNTLIVGEGGIGSELSSRLAKDPSTHLNFATSRNAEVPEAMNVSWLPLSSNLTDQLKSRQTPAVPVLKTGPGFFATGYLHGDSTEKSIKDLESSRLMHSYRGT